VQVPATFNPVTIAAEPAPSLPMVPAVPETAGSIEIEFATGGRMRITGPVDARTVSALMKALARGKRRQ
jgi:transposase